MRPELLVIGLAGFLAQLVDGSLGMGYGVSASSILLAAGTAPAAVSASVNLAQVGTTLASGVSHWRADNVDLRVLPWLAVPGMIGGLTGALLLSVLPMTLAGPVMAAVLTLLGLSVLWRFVRLPDRAQTGPADTDRAPDDLHRAPARTAMPSRLALVPLALVGGTLTGCGGGGWGPVVTSTLLSRGTAPRTTIGSVSAAEFAVTVGASSGFLLGLGLGAVSVGPVLALLIGGAVAAPIAARVAGRLPARLLGLAVGAMVLVLNVPRLLQAVGVLHAPIVAVQGILAGSLLVGVLLAVAALHLQRARPAGRSSLGSVPDLP
ncbi:sulfite exporter TauE/SafE family protein [Brachybacterium sp. EF45031]|uniref:sulfite exporter TauE/SafE family protein n=1 Tax=Brachybacterium sillae TaxID=2810536 RepID=UPI00217D27B8|nr:sulfite exporter TauE/SafE family protein [Brachybacterium sillae]MCS6710876.1 sulfite exporter TauE/SafE family protein [Brachybacterium sillae]